MKEDTICAVSTAMSDAGVGIIRVSGEDAFTITDKLFTDGAGRRRLLSYASHTIHYGYIEDPDTGERLDEVLVSVMRAPHSYTRENVAEINCHGGRFVLQRMLELLIKNGCRMAEPGEFTKRAYLNGRIDLSEAHAVMDIISSENEFALKNALKQLSGKLSEDIESIRQIILHESARIEAALDDPDAYDLEGYPEQLRSVLNDLTKKLNDLVRSYDEGHIRRDGIDTVIIGMPNAGKSSLFNRLAGSDRAIVTEIPGTTRDLIEEKVRVGELVLNITDTAGIRDTEDTVEKIGVERALSRASDCALVLYVKDASDEDKEILLPETSDDTRFIILINKTDLCSDCEGIEDHLKKRLSERGYGEDRFSIIRTSMLTGEGLGSVKDEICRLFLKGELVPREEYYLTDIRQKKAAEKAADSLELVKKSIDTGMSEELYLRDLMDAYSALGSITGEQTDDDLADEIFSAFCMGK